MPGARRRMHLDRLIAQYGRSPARHIGGRDPVQMGTAAAKFR